MTSVAINLILVFLLCATIRAYAATGPAAARSSRSGRAVRRLKLTPTSTSTSGVGVVVGIMGKGRGRGRCRYRSDEPRSYLTSETMAASSSSSSSSRDCRISPSLERVRRGGGGGGGFLAEILDAPSSSTSSSKISPPGPTGAKTATIAANASPKIGSTAIASTVVVVVLVVLLTAIVKRDRPPRGVFFDGDRFRSLIVRGMGDVASRGDAGLLMYAIGFALWEACGLPTSIVETAAGMAFGRSRGLLGSFVGKTFGSCLAFVLGRTLLSDVVSRRMEGSEAFGAVVRGASRNPVRTAFVVRYSVFPQAIKNFGMALTTPVSFPVFLSSAIVHGLPFSTLWAALGDDAGARLRALESGGEMPANLVLNGLLAFVTIFGFVVSPTITGLWLADLRREG